MARIEAVYQPTQVWLFGSRARGTSHAGSDWDLLAVVDDDTPAERLAPSTVWDSLDLDHVVADVIVLPRSVFEEDRDVPNTLAWPVAREGRLVYER